MAADWIKGAYLALAAPPPLDKRQCYQHCVRMNRWKKTKDGQIALANKRAEAWWKFPEALDPDQPDGSAIACHPILRHPKAVRCLSHSLISRLRCGHRTLVSSHAD